MSQKAIDALDDMAKRLGWSDAAVVERALVFAQDHADPKRKPAYEAFNAEVPREYVAEKAQ